MLLTILLAKDKKNGMVPQLFEYELSKEHIAMANALAEPIVNLRSGLISPEAFDDYQRNGAICVRGVIDPPMIEALRQATAAAIEAQAATNEAGGTPRPTGPHFHILRNVYDDGQAFRDLLEQSPLAAIARDLMQSRKVILFGDSLFDKEAGAKTTTPWHHDVPFWPLRGEQVCTTWIALDHVSKANGAMEYIAGSHLWNRIFRPKYPDGAPANANPLHLAFEEIPDFDNARDQHDFLYWELEPGDVLLHSGMTVHGAGENTRLDIGRRAYAPRFVGDAVWWDPDYSSGKTPARAAPLVKGDPLDRHGCFPVILGE